MKERNRHTLKAALAAMRSYRASQDGWERLTQELDALPPSEAGQELLQDSLRTMPRYQAPPTVWQRLEPQLPGRRPRWHWLPVSVAAAVLLSLGLLSWYQWQTRPLAALPPQAEQRSSPAPEIAEMAIFDPATAQLAECLTDAPEEVQRATAPELAALQAMAQRRDSLQAAGDFQPAQRLASQHQARLQALWERHCATK